MNIVEGQNKIKIDSWMDLVPNLLIDSVSKINFMQLPVKRIKPVFIEMKYVSHLFHCTKITIHQLEFSS
jgi:hypothetical protein